MQSGFEPASENECHRPGIEDIYLGAGLDFDLSHSWLTKYCQSLINKYILFLQRGHRDSDMSYKNIITWDKINQIRWWEPLETQTIQPKKYMKYAKEFGYAGQMLPILINYMIIQHTLTYWGIILSTINPMHITYWMLSITSV